MMGVREIGVLVIKGFTLLEMIVVIGIFGIVSSIVIWNYNKFTGNTVLTNMAYELALSVREAQLFGTSAIGNSSNINTFNQHIGARFVKGTDSYIIFIDENNNNMYDNTGDTIFKTLTLQSGVVVEEVNVCDVAGSINTLDIVFARPNPEPIINGSFLESAQIKIVSKTGTARYVKVNGAGQVEVTTDSC